MSVNLPSYWEIAKSVLSAKDRVMAGIIACYTGKGLNGRGEAFHTLARSIVGQQISVKAADAVWGKLETRILDLGFGGMSPAAVVGMDDEALRASGLSRQKVLYLRAIAEHFDRNAIVDGYFHDKSDEEVLKELVSIKGIGKWTAEMFLMFHLMRPDVFPVDDIGVQKAIERHYSPEIMPLKTGMTKKEYYARLNALAESWRPYRSVATWYLWRSLDPVPVAY